MPRKGMRSLCFHAKTPSFATPSDGVSVSLSARALSLSESTMEKVIQSAESIIMKWDADTSAYARVTSLFYEDKREAARFIKRVNDLQMAMQSLVLENSMSEKLVHAHRLMEVAMKRLQKELYQILSMNRSHLDPESVSARSSRTSLSTRSSVSDFEVEESLPEAEDFRAAGNSISEVEEVASIVMSDLKAIAECMISSGYGKECISIYKIIRKSIIDEGIYRLGVERITQSHIQKMNWEAVDGRIKNWLDGMKIAMNTLFNGERILCDHVFSASDAIRESCFSEISREGATILFEFPGTVVKSRKSPEKIFRLLDMYTAISENWREIESIFGFDSTSIVRAQALNSLVRLSESVRALLADFETALQKDSSKTAPPGGGVHELTVTTMNYLCLLADYSNILGDIFGDWPTAARSPLPESYFYSPAREDAPAPAISVHISWLILVLLCKLDGKAKHYKDVSVSYLFLANNLQHIVSRVRASNLQYLLGEEWLVKHDEKVMQFVANYERIGWGNVIESLPENSNSVAAVSPAEAEQCFKRFSSSFEEAYRRQSSSVVPDPTLREKIRDSIKEKIVPVYKAFHYTAFTHEVPAEERRRTVSLPMKYSPEDVESYLSDLFIACRHLSGSSFSSSSWSSLSRR